VQDLIEATHPAFAELTTCFTDPSAICNSSVALMGGFSNVLNAKVEDQIKAKNVEADVVIFQTV